MHIFTQDKLVLFPGGDIQNYYIRFQTLRLVNTAPIQTGLTYAWTVLHTGIFIQTYINVSAWPKRKAMGAGSILICLAADTFSAEK